MGVSRFSLREALRVSQNQGLIEITRGRRPRVAEPTADAAAQMLAITLRRSSQTLLDLADARIVLETHIARVAAGKASDADIAQMQETIDIVAANETDPNACVEQDYIFHGCLVKATGNVVFEVMLAPLAELLREARKETFREGVAPVINGHIAVLKAIRDRDPDAAEQAMRAHLVLARKHLMKSGSGAS